METILYIYIFILGLVLGSFYNVVGIRVADGESIVKPRSHCPRCQRTLSASELIPVLSYLFQRGTCKGCGTKVSIKYPLFEGLTACLFLVAAVLVGWTSELLIALLLISLLVIITISDLHKMLIPNKILLFFFIVFIPITVLIPHEPWWDGIVGFFVGGGLLYLIAIVSRGGMGGGDVKLFAVLGFILGTRDVLLTLFAATFIGAVVGGIMMMTGKVKRKNPIPFGPFIAIGALVIYFFGESLWHWYVQFL
ncbi:prepilin peptidase [Desertibacillus haloalkaliphilus]|uniref:prepilin peptidase n=1 Tax=Desertibacillus haloalkaliphilus TaxID=1328930 RepID=UPI001C263F6D|nr:A24 family peptidase [Desertibacillus haloalkaliphilus]MBU8905047.1 prepilin peptidase [Desertibacillus haloalkaliphilus]